MWTCPVCDCTNADNVCVRCGFDRSTDYANYPTLTKQPSQRAAASRLRDKYLSTKTTKLCNCCGSMITGGRCNYCGFVPNNEATDSLQEPEYLRAAQHTEKTLASLTDFSIVAYRYGWEPLRSRLELQEETLVSFGDARNIYRNIVWADQEFGQQRNGTGTELYINVTYRHNGKKTELRCAIPTIKSERFWRFGMSLDATMHLKLYLGAGTNFVESAPIALNLN